MIPFTPLGMVKFCANNSVCTLPVKQSSKVLLDVLYITYGNYFQEENSSCYDFMEAYI